MIRPRQDDRTVGRQGPGEAEVRVVGELVDDGMAGIQAGGVVTELARIAEEDRPDDLVRELLPELTGRERHVHGRRGAGRQVLEDRDRPAEHDGRLEQGLRGVVAHGPLQAPVLEPDVREHERDGHRGLRPDRAQRSEADTEVSDTGWIALDHVQAGRRPVAAEEVAADRR
jgi:hypothetical protein